MCFPDGKPPHKRLEIIPAVAGGVDREGDVDKGGTALMEGRMVEREKKAQFMFWECVICGFAVKMHL
jgi:hypothetical protein